MSSSETNAPVVDGPSFLDELDFRAKASLALAPLEVASSSNIGCSNNNASLDDDEPEAPRDDGGVMNWLENLFPPMASDASSIDPDSNGTIQNESDSQTVRLPDLHALPPTLFTSSSGTDGSGINQKDSAAHGTGNSVAESAAVKGEGGNKTWAKRYQELVQYKKNREVHESVFGGEGGVEKSGRCKVPAKDKSNHQLGDCRKQSACCLSDELQVQMRQVQCLSSLPPGVQKALKILSCFGSSVSCEIIALIESAIRVKVTEHTATAIAEGFVYKRDDQFHFAHDQVRQACYGMIPEAKRRTVHLKLGIRLVKVAKNDDNIFHIALCHLNLAGPSIVADARKSAVIAQHNLAAGKKALDKNNYSSAGCFFQNGISFLKGVHWRFYYKLSLELYELSAKCSLSLGDFARIISISHEVTNNAICFEDQLNTSFTVMLSLAYVNRIAESVTFGLSILRNLGHELPTNLGQNDVLTLVKQTQNDLRAISDNDLINYRKMSDKRHLNAIKCLSKMEMVMFQGGLRYHPIVTLKIVNITLSHGMTPGESAVGFGYYAGILAKLGELQDAHRFAKLAKKLLDQDGVKEFAGNVIFTTSEIFSLFQPSSAVNGYRIQGQSTALLAGDVQSVCLLRYTFCMSQFLAGINLQAIKDAILEAGQYVREKNNWAIYNLLQILKRNVLVLLGEAGVFELMAEEQADPFHMRSFVTQKLFQAIIMNNYGDIKQYADRFVKFGTSHWFLSLARAALVLYSGLAYYRIFRETGVKCWLERGRQCKSSMQLWAEQCSSENFEHKWNLLEAEEAYSNGNFETAKSMYSKAVTSAHQHKFVQEEALITELAGYCYLSAGMRLASLKHFERAHAKYVEWGAMSKAKRLFGFTLETFKDATADFTPGSQLQAERT